MHKRRLPKWILFLVAVLVVGISFPALVAAVGDDAPPLPPAKQAIEDAYEQRRSQAPAVRKDPETIRRVKDEFTRAHPPVSQQPWPAGIFEGPDAPFPSSEVKIVNRWVEVADGRNVVVYAGSDAQDPEQGVLIFQVYSSDSLALLEGGRRASAEKAGPLRIIAANNGRLTIKPERGSPVEFDVQSRRFVPTESVERRPR